MSNLDLRRTFQEFNRMDLARADYKSIVKKLREASKDTTIPLISSTGIYFRARICNSGEVDHISQLWAPPPSSVVGYQRCNPPGVPMFYAASNRQAALIEIGAQDEDLVFLSQWISKSPLPINRIFTPQLPEETKDLSPRDMLFNNYLDTLFTRQIHESFSDQYKLTAAATEVLTTKFVEDSFSDVRMDGTVGLRYPSVADRFKSENTVFHADFARERLELIHVTKLKIVTNSTTNPKIVILDTVLETVDGSLIWQGSPNHIPLPLKDRGRVTIIPNGRSWTVPVFQHPPSETDISKFLSE